MKRQWQASVKFETSAKQRHPSTWMIHRWNDGCSKRVEEGLPVGPRRTQVQFAERVNDSPEDGLWRPRLEKVEHFPKIFFQLLTMLHEVAAPF